METVPEFEFWHHLYDTVLLLGGRKDVADMVVKALDDQLTAADVHALRAFNSDLTTLAKDRLAYLYTITVRKGDTP